MNITVNATSDLIEYLETNCPDDKRIEIVRQKELTNEGRLQGFITMSPGDILLSIIITYSPTILGLLKQYVKEKKRNIVVRTDKRTYPITPQNTEKDMVEL